MEEPNKLGNSPNITTKVLKSAFRPHLFPHDNIEAAAGLVGKHNACVVVVSIGIYVKCDTKVYGAELVISCSKRVLLIMWTNHFHYIHF